MRTGVSWGRVPRASGKKLDHTDSPAVGYELKSSGKALGFTHNDHSAQNAEIPSEGLKRLAVCHTCSNTEQHRFPAHDGSL